MGKLGSVVTAIVAAVVAMLGVWVFGMWLGAKMMVDSPPKFFAVSNVAEQTNNYPDTPCNPNIRIRRDADGIECACLPNQTWTCGQ